MSDESAFENPRNGLWRTLSVAIGAILLSSAIPAIAMLNSQAVLADDGSESHSAADVSVSASEAYSDFNGDGYDDLAIGVPNEDIGSMSNAGVVNVIYGSSASLRTSPAGDGTGRADQLWHQNVAGVEDSSESSDMFGFALAAGNFNGDNFMDLAIGAPGESVGSAAEAGAVNVLYGSSAGLRATSPGDQLWTQNSAGVDNSAGASDGFGSSLVAGDFNGDGRDDLAIGVPNEDVGPVGGAGAVSVLYGSSAGLRSSSPADQFWHQGKPGIDDVENGNDHFGFAVSSGDYNNDGYDDLAIGVPGEDIETDDPDFGDLENTGGVHVIFGSSSGLQTSSPAEQFWDGEPGHWPDEFENTFEERAGWSLASGDFNNDDYYDLAVGVPGESSATQNNDIEGGAVSVVYGSATGLETGSSPDTQFWHPELLDVGFVGTLFGWSLTAGDFNGDGRDDLAVGVPGEDIGTADDAGAVNLIHGTSAGLRATSPADQLWHQGKPGVEDAEEDGEGFGSLSTGLSSFDL